MIRYQRVWLAVILLFLIASASFVSWTDHNLITGYATKQEIIASYTEFFRYGAERNFNLFEALELISVEFNKEGVEITPDLLAAIVITLEKEVGGSFKPVEEIGDTCRVNNYVGGCDYKGRGYIQITHVYNYRVHCGEDCLVGYHEDACQCEYRRYCAITDMDLCKPAKALLPDRASKIFVSYYLARNLVELSQRHEYWTVGKRINGGDSYANDFQSRASRLLTRLHTNSEKTDMLLDYLNEYEGSGDLPEEGEIIRPEILPTTLKMPEDAETLYAVYPSFETTIDYDIYEYQTLVEQAQQLLNDVESCKLLIGFPGEPVSLQECVITRSPANWEVVYLGATDFCFEVESDKEARYYNDISGETEVRNVVYKFALHID